MRSRRASLVEGVALGLAAAATTWLATLAWRGFTRDVSGYFVPLLVVGLVVALSGAALRWSRASGVLVVLGQLVASAMAVTAVLTGSLLPVGASGRELVDEVTTAVANAQQYRAPVPEEGSVAALLILGGWACLLLVDLCACTARRVSLAGLPLMAVYSVPVSMLGGGVAWWVFALTAAGFLTMLYLQHSDAIDRWGRSLEQRPEGAGRAPSVRAGAGSVGAAATGLAVFVPLLVPSLSLELLDFGPGDGPGSEIAVENPMTDLRRDLQRGEDVPLLRFSTDDPSPSYLRIAALNRFNDNEWSTGDRDIPTDQRAQGPMPMPELDRSVARTPYDYEMTAMSEFESRWLPTQFPVSRISAVGDWRYDTATLDFLAADDDLDTAGLSYSFTSVDLDLEAELLAEAPSSAGEVDSSYRDLPDDFPAMVTNLALEVTRDHPSRYEKAVALQDWFREDGGFTYDLENVPSGSGPDELVEFLTEGENGRRGYCEQFASAMAAMARSLGIPARVAVGFLVPRRTGDTWEYSAWDMHAWPELYFSGAGWVRFEPTPADRASGVPSYTSEELLPAPEDDPSAPASDAPAPAQTQGADPRLDEGVISQDDSAVADQGFPWAQVVGGGLVALLVVALLLLPRTLRHRQALARLSGAPEAAWQELAATARDLGVAWPVDRSPRQTRDRLVDQLGPTDPEEAAERPRRGAEASPEGVAALDRLVRALERLRYSRGRDAGDAEAIVADTRTVIAALQGGSDARSRRRARWWPASVLPARRRGKAGAGERPVLVTHAGVVDHVG